MAINSKTRQLEIRVLETRSLTQTISLDLSSDPWIDGSTHIVYLLSSNKVIRLDQTPYQDQISQLIADKEYTEALALVGRLQSIPLDEKQAREKEIKCVIGKRKFCYERQYQAGLDTMTECEALLSEVLELYSGYMTPRLKQLYQGLPTVANRTELLTEYAPLGKQKVVFSRLLIEVRLDIQNPDSSAWRALINYLTTYRHRFAGVSEFDGAVEKEIIVVDTALLLSYVEIESSLLGSFVRLNNHADLSESESILEARNVSNSFYCLHNHGLTVLEICRVIRLLLRKKVAY